MKIRLEAFGPISHFEFDLEKDLHVIFGKNNIGKSYAITAVYLVLKNLLNNSTRSHNDVGNLFADFSTYYEKISEKNELYNCIQKTEKKIAAVLKNNDAEHYTAPDVTEDVKLIFANVTNQLFVKDLQNSFLNSFVSVESLQNKFSKKNTCISISTDNISLAIRNNGNCLEVKDVHFDFQILVKREQSQNAEIRYILPGLSGGDFNIIECISYLYYIFKNKVSEIISSVNFLPASRAGLYQALNTFSSIITELSKSRSFLTQKIELPNISEPVADYFLKLSNIGSRVKNNLSDITEAIEMNILNGSVLFNSETRKIVFKENGIEEAFELSYTSSMVSRVAPVVAYLKFIVSTEKRSGRPGSNNNYGILFIEDPEAHLHPEVQVKLMEMFALLAGKNLKVVMTSQSNYMFNELRNLVSSGKTGQDKVGCYLMWATEAGSVTDMLPMEADGDAADNEKFADVAAHLYEERIKIHDTQSREDGNAD